MAKPIPYDTILSRFPQNVDYLDLLNFKPRRQSDIKIVKLSIYLQKMDIYVYFE